MAEIIDVANAIFKFKNDWIYTNDKKKVSDEDKEKFFFKEDDIVIIIKLNCYGSLVSFHEKSTISRLVLV